MEPVSENLVGTDIVLFVQGTIFKATMFLQLTK